MKIGILTFHKAINYGSVLQTWSTQTLLEKAGYEVEVIDYEPGVWSSLYGTFRKGRSLSVLKQNIKILPIAYFSWKRTKGFECFRKNKLHLSEEKYMISSDFSKLAQKYDCIICGSDQIWNIDIQDCDPIYFLPNIPVKKKIAYAVSVGNSDLTNERANEELKKQISDFNAITVREERTIERINHFVGAEKVKACTLDPTLLHNKEEFYSICAPRRVKEDYIFLYNIWNVNEGFQIAKEVSNRKKLPVYTIMTVKSLHILYRIYKNDIRIVMTKTAPEDYLSYFRYASFTITDSFHGTAFSIIFEKPFLCVNYTKPDGSYKNDIRLRNVLGYYDLTDRYVTAAQVKEYNLDLVPDYTVVTKKRMEQAEKSIDLLLSEIDEGGN